MLIGCLIAGGVFAYAVEKGWIKPPVSPNTPQGLVSPEPGTPPGSNPHTVNGGSSEMNNANATAKTLDEYRATTNATITGVLENARSLREAKGVADVASVQQHRKHAVAALNAVHQLEEGLILLDRELGHAERSFKVTADGFRARGMDYPDQKLKGTAAEWAAYFDSRSAACPGERKRVQDFLKAMPGTISLTRDTAKWLDDYLLFLNSQTDPTKVPATEIAKAETTLREFVQKFSAFESAAESYRK
jgi:hypothetical protein